MITNIKAATLLLLVSIAWIAPVTVNAQDEEDRRTLGIEPIDLVAVNLYPFAETIRKDPAAREAAIEMIDVGGPTMLRAAAKNHRSVAVICDPALPVLLATGEAMTCD